MKRINFKTQNQQPLIKKQKPSEVLKEEKPKYTITETHLKHCAYEKGYHHWHKHCKYECVETGASIKISDSIAGCAIQHLYEWVGSQDKKGIIEVLKDCIKNLHPGVGLVTCQVGSTFVNSLLVKGLLELGFIDHKYNNYQHDEKGDEQGHFFTLTIEK